MGTESKNWVRLPKVRFLGQPVGLGLVLLIPGGVMTVLMIMALSATDPWYITVGTVFLILGFLYMFLLGAYYRLMPFEKLWIREDEIRLQLGTVVLRRIGVEQVRSIIPEVRTVLVKNRDADLYRLKIYPEGKGLQARVLWVDWSVATQEALHEVFRDKITLLF